MLGHYCRQHGHYRNDIGADYLYHCPGCKLDMPRVSSLFQHVEMEACVTSYNRHALKTLVQVLKRRAPT